MKKILCKCDYDLFKKGKYYEYSKLSNSYLTIVIYDKINHHTCYTDTCSVEKYFYTDKQIRKIKLKKINEKG